MTKIIAQASTFNNLCAGENYFRHRRKETDFGDDGAKRFFLAVLASRVFFCRLLHSTQQILNLRHFQLGRVPRKRKANRKKLINFSRSERSLVNRKHWQLTRVSVTFFRRIHAWLEMKCVFNFLKKTLCCFQLWNFIRAYRCLWRF